MRMDPPPSVEKIGPKRYDATMASPRLGTSSGPRFALFGPRSRVWVDTDVALGARWGDVDDGFALAALLRCPSVEILGISTVFGNTTPEVAARCARELTGRDVIVGAARP